MYRHNRKLFTLILAAGATVLIALFAACSSPTDPPPPEPVKVYTFVPAEKNLTFNLGDQQEFRVDGTTSSDLETQWMWRGEQLGTNTVLNFAADFVGNDTLKVDITEDGKLTSSEWYIHTETEPDSRPPLLWEVTVNHGPWGGEAVVTWPRIPQAQSTYTISDYVVASSTDGPITLDNWDSANMAAVVPDIDHVNLTVTLGADDGLVGGQRVWFSVRSRDIYGQMSLVHDPRSIVVSISWWIEGIVSDDNGRAMAQSIVDYGCDTCKVETDINGYYRIGPFHEFNEVFLQTITNDLPDNSWPYESWYDIKSDTLSYPDDQNVDLVVITRYPTSPACSNYNDDFLTFIRDVTFTNELPDAHDVLLDKWDHYPLTVYTPEHTSQNGWDYKALCRDAAEIWNSNMGEEYFVFTDSFADADVYFEIIGAGGGAYGRASVVEPVDAGCCIGLVSPEKMRVQLQTNMFSEQFVKEVTLHELGHVLAFGKHVGCSGYLMCTACAAGALNDGPDNAIGEDERNIVRTVRYLKNHQDMSRYETRDNPW